MFDQAHIFHNAHTLDRIHPRADCWSRRVLFALGLFVSHCAPLDPDVEFLRAKESASVTSDAGNDEVIYARDVLPIFKQENNCKYCHDAGEKNPQGYFLSGLDFTNLGTIRRGGVSSAGTIIVPGDPDASALIQKVEGTYKQGSRMPRGRPPLTTSEIAVLRKWIAQGAKGKDSE
jgi:Planctomycete cytochrome C